MDNIFAKVIRKEVPANVVYEDADVIVIHDVSPQAPVHLLVMPKKSIAGLDCAADDDQELLGKLLLTAKKLASEKFGLENGYRVVINVGPDGGQTVYHLHVHVLGGRYMGKTGGVQTLGFLAEWYINQLWQRLGSWITSLANIFGMFKRQVSAPC